MHHILLCEIGLKAPQVKFAQRLSAVGASPELEDTRRCKNDKPTLYLPILYICIADKNSYHSQPICLKAVVHDLGNLTSKIPNISRTFVMAMYTFVTWLACPPSQHSLSVPFSLRCWYLTWLALKFNLSAGDQYIELDPYSKIRTKDDIDKYMSAEPIADPTLFQIITRCMIHGPCGTLNPNSQCMREGVCTKQYPKEFREKSRREYKWISHVSKKVYKICLWNEFNLWEKSRTVVRSDVHLPDPQAIVYQDGQEEEAFARAATRQTTFTAWFELNKNDQDSRNYLYTYIPHYYAFNKSAMKWQKRQRVGEQVIGRMPVVNIQHSERYYLRLLLLRKLGAVSFDDLKTVDGIVYNTFQQIIFTSSYEVSGGLVVRAAAFYFYERGFDPRLGGVRSFVTILHRNRLKIKGNNRSYKKNLKIGIVVQRLLSRKVGPRVKYAGVIAEELLHNTFPYMIMKILRMRIVDGIRSSFRCVRNMENVTRKEIEDPTFINECVEQNFASLKSLPPIFHTLVFYRNKRGLRVTSRNKRVSRVTKRIREVSRNKRELRVTMRNRGTSKNKRVTRVE
ncbi:hypothetical protein AVEN_9000-1 [Araneus ventricosus]|uniref:Helitron helicase-like domain-containing protein n=1 Tax=Araneus ventricosus TaxID=182803 RepID=A0A4Y2DRR3_ARAVE|nr:hypothetical protein AVEN_9000-1 [Araneus ventricosus]